MRYENIKLLNPYHGVEIVKTAGLDKYKARIHINGNFVIGTYNTIEKAAIAYNKAVDMAHAHGIEKKLSRKLYRKYIRQWNTRIFTLL